MAWTAEYRQRKLAEDPLFDRKRNLKSRYGLSYDDYEALLVSQDCMCALCSESFGDETPCVDHDHDTGRVRGLLCRQCHAQLGWFESRAETITNYLREV